MSWSDLPAIHRDLAAALATYDWDGAKAICDRVIRMVQQASTPCPAADAKQIIAELRKKRRFELIVPVAEALWTFGQQAPRIRRQYAQALIDQGLLVAPEPILQTLLSESLDDDSQFAEAHGLLGRIYKQRYVNADRPANSYVRTFFERALTEYLQVYRINPSRHYWHGINVVALLHRGRADGLPMQNAPDPDVLAREILEAVRDAAGSSDPFALATRLETLIALGEHGTADETALTYSRHPDADAFEFASTLRQLQEVWRLTDQAPPGSTILPILRAARVHAESGTLQAGPSVIREETACVARACAQLERNFGDDRIVTLKWYETGLQRTRSIARVERLNGRGHGTGWLVRAEDFFDGRTGLLLLTNAHVVNAIGSGGALRPDQAQANFQGLGATVAFEDEVVWSSPPEMLDATFLAFSNDPPDAAALPLSRRKTEMRKPEPRVYVIGHPSGRDLELSLHDNKLLGCNDRVLHYRAPTERGSSGSPVFDDESWHVIGLHHAGGRYDRLDGGTPQYDANEGISILAIQRATKP